MRRRNLKSVVMPLDMSKPTHHEIFAEYYLGAAVVVAVRIDAEGHVARYVASPEEAFSMRPRIERRVPSSEPKT